MNILEYMETNTLYNAFLMQDEFDNFEEYANHVAEIKYRKEIDEIERGMEEYYEDNFKNDIG